MFGQDSAFYQIIQPGQELRLTDSPAFDDWPSWSPDGSRIAFQSDRDGSGNQEIYVMNADGSGQTRLTNNPAVDQSPAWGIEVLPVVTTNDANPISTVSAGLNGTVDCGTWTPAGGSSKNG